MKRLLILLPALLIAGLLFAQAGAQKLPIGASSLPPEEFPCDVPENHWAYEAVLLGRELGIIVGDETSSPDERCLFRGGEFITRYEALVMVLRALLQDRPSPRQIEEIVIEGDRYIALYDDGTRDDLGPVPQDGKDGRDGQDGLSVDRVLVEDGEAVFIREDGAELGRIPLLKGDDGLSIADARTEDGFVVFIREDGLELPPVPLPRGEDGLSIVDVREEGGMVYFIREDDIALGPIALPRGAEGPPGPAGPAGPRASRELTDAEFDAGALEDGSGLIPGDSYRHPDGNLRVWNGSDWEDRGPWRIVGPVGPEGPAGPTGEAGRSSVLSEICNDLSLGVGGYYKTNSESFGLRVNGSVYDIGCSRFGVRVSFDAGQTGPGLGTLALSADALYTIPLDDNFRTHLGLGGGIQFGATSAFGNNGPFIEGLTALEWLPFTGLSLFLEFELAGHIPQFENFLSTRLVVGINVHPTQFLGGN